MKTIKRNAGILLTFALLIVCATGITASAKDLGKFTNYGYSGGKLCVLFTNTSGSRRYCASSMYESNTLSNSGGTLVDSFGGVLRNNEGDMLGAYVYKNYAFVNGYVYHSTSAASGVASSIHKRVK